METSNGNAATATDQESSLRFYLRQEPMILAGLTLLAIVCFIVVAGLSRIYHAQQNALGSRWFARGVADLNARRYASAVSDFRTALLYSRDNYDYRLNLAEALIGQKRTSEAYAYLVNLWDRQPENGLVNLELARIAVKQNNIEHALRYYHNAIYATWPDNQESERRDTRLELIDYLLSINAKAQAQSEMIALSANLGDDPAQHARVGSLFLRTQDYEHALAEYRESLSLDRHNAAAMAGAGTAAYELGRYDIAQRYLQEAVSANADDTDSASRLRTVELVLQLDPFRRKISAKQRDANVIKAFAAAGQRLNVCPTAPQDLSDEWKKMKPEVTRQGLRRNPDLVESVMQLVFSVERQTSAACGVLNETDKALLLIAKLHEGSERG